MQFIILTFLIFSVMQSMQQTHNKSVKQSFQSNESSNDQQSHYTQSEKINIQNDIKVIEVKKNFDERTVSTKYLPNSANIISSTKVIETYSSKKIENSMFNQSYIPNEYHHTIQYTGTFQQIRNIFVNFSFEKKFVVVKQNDNIIIVKKNANFSYKCILSFCFPIAQDNFVCELKNYPSKPNTAKIIFISGVNITQQKDNQEYQRFNTDLCSILWNAGKIRVNSNQAVQYYYNLNKMGFQFIKKQCQSFKFSKDNKVSFEFAISLLRTIQQRLIVLKQNLNSCEKIKVNPSILKRIDEIVYKDVKIYLIFQKIFQYQSSMFTSKRQQVLNNYTIEEVFDYLEVGTDYRGADYRGADHRGINKQSVQMPINFIQDRDKLPYFSAIQLLEGMQFSKCPSTLVQLVSTFSHRLCNYCNARSNKAKLTDLDMDNILPLTIYCVVMCKNECLYAVCRMMLQYLQFEEGFEPEKKVFTTLEASIDYIRNQWKMK